jgi:hypothetical protein
MMICFSSESFFPIKKTGAVYGELSEYMYPFSYSSDGKVCSRSLSSFIRGYTLQLITLGASGIKGISNSPSLFSGKCFAHSLSNTRWCHSYSHGSTQALSSQWASRAHCCATVVRCTHTASSCVSFPAHCQASFW